MVVFFTLSVSKQKPLIKILPKYDVPVGTRLTKNIHYNIVYIYIYTILYTIYSGSDWVVFDSDRLFWYL